MNENIRPVIASDESVALGIVKPLDLPFVLSHRLPLSLLRARNPEGKGNHHPVYDKTPKSRERLNQCLEINFTKWDGPASKNRPSAEIL
jgi:hypothetical protein